MAASILYQRVIGNAYYLDFISRRKAFRNKLAEKLVSDSKEDVKSTGKALADEVSYISSG